jgi:23S rRNA pseudouridine2605 synthase
MNSEKVHKRIAATGLCSRRGAEQLVIAGRVRVNGRRVLAGSRVSENDKIEVDGKALRTGAIKPVGSKPRVLLYHKPVGEICSRDDPEGRPSVYDALPRPTRGRWISVGRLDFNTSGVLLFTDDGDLSNRLSHPSSGAEREYVVRVQGDVSEGMLRRLQKGVMLDDGMANFSDIRKAHYPSEGANRWFYVVLMSGRNREVKRLWESQDVRVSRLKRVRFANIILPARLTAGRYQLVEGAALDGLLATATVPEALAR